MQAPTGVPWKERGVLGAAVAQVQLGSHFHRREDDDLDLDVTEIRAALVISLHGADLLGRHDQALAVWREGERFQHVQRLQRGAELQAPL